MTTKDMKGWSTSPIIREMQMQIKITMRHFIILIRMSLIKNQKITCVSKNMELLKHLFTIGRLVEWCSHHGIHYRGTSKN